MRTEAQERIETMDEGDVGTLGISDAELSGAFSKVPVRLKIKLTT
jgi:hypothetical protein